MDVARHAILVGSSEFPDEPKLQPLQAPGNDVDNLAALLNSEERGGFTSVSILKDRPHYEVVRQIQRTLNRAGRDDLVLLYYSGHGKLNRAGHLYLTALDTVLTELESSAIAVGTIRDFVDVSKSKRVLIILDCCFSGAVGDVFSKGAVDDQLQLASSEGRGTYIMTASTGIQTAQEKEADQQSVFTKHLVAGIETGEADQDRDGLITVDELYDYVHRKVREESHQEPTHWGLDVRGHFVVARSGRKPRKERAGQLRPLLFTLAKERRISDDILTEALNVIKLPTTGLSEAQRERDGLLQDLLDRKLEAIEFVVRWTRIADGNAARNTPPAASSGAAQATPDTTAAAAEPATRKPAAEPARSAAKTKPKPVSTPDPEPSPPTPPPPGPGRPDTPATAAPRVLAGGIDWSSVAKVTGMMAAVWIAVVVLQNLLAGEPVLYLTFGGYF